MPGKRIRPPVWLAGTVLAAALILGGIAGLLAARHTAFGLRGPVFRVAAASTEPARIGETFAPILRGVAPAVVSISSSKTVRARAPAENLEPFLQDPFHRRFLVTS